MSEYAPYDEDSFIPYVTSSGEFILAHRLYKRHDRTDNKLIDIFDEDISHLEAYPVPKHLERDSTHWAVIFYIAKIEFNEAQNGLSKKTGV